MAQYKVGYIIGSLSTRSINRRLAGALVRLAPESLALEEIPIRDLPLYNHDVDADFPAVARELKTRIEGSDALLFVTPEYNRSIPGALKNAIDWASRPWGKNSFSGKPCAVIGGSIGAIGTAIAQSHLRVVMGFCAAPMMGQPEGYLTITPELIADDGQVTVDSTRKFLAGYMQSFAAFVAGSLGT